jgi:DNA polymerase-1
VTGIGRVFRPLIVPEDGRGIGEVDLSQIEIGITAAVYDDPVLIEKFNGDDVYVAMAKEFFRAELSAEDLRLSAAEFKKKHGKLRDQLKICTLGIIYGLTPHGLALRLKIPEFQAKAQLEHFLDLFPALRQARADAVAYGAMRGYALAVSGLRRYRAPGAGQTTPWEKNWLTNFPVQASAAVVFKAAGNRLDKLYQRHDAWLVLPLHDAFVFEAPQAALSEVAQLTQTVMCAAVQEYFPRLRPRAEINVLHPTCWNKDGHADSVDQWLADALYSF